MFSIEDINTIVGRAFDGEPINILDYCQNSYSKERVGFLGSHQNLEVTIKRNDSNKSETHRFFMKAMPVGSEKQLKFIRERGVFRQEAVFFNSMLPLLKETYVGEDWCPKCLLANDEVIVLEDMRAKGFAMLDNKIFKGEYLKSALRAQARLHASSILAEAKLGKSLQKVCPDACIEQIYNEVMLKSDRLELLSDLAEQIAKRCGRDHRRIRAGFYKGFMQLLHSEGKSKLSRVVSHGDTWSNNCLFDSSEPPKCVLVDFQLVRYAPRMFDVAQLMYLSTTCDIRRKEELEAIKAYLQELNDVLRRINPSLERPSLKNILEEYENVRLTAMLAAILYYPIIFLTKTELAKYDHDQDGLYKKIMFREVNDFVMDLYDRDSDYANRLTELVLEVVEYCEKFNIPIEKESDTSTTK